MPTRRVPPEPVDRLDDRGRATVSPAFRARLRDGFVQVLTPDGVLFAPVATHIKAAGPSLDDVDDEAAKDL